MSLRIAGGSLRGLKVSVPKVQKVRPTSERVREALQVCHQVAQNLPAVAHSSWAVSESLLNSVV